MISFLVRRLAGLLVTLLVTSFVIFGALYIAPGGPLAYLLGGRSVTPKIAASIKHQYHLDDPFLVRYWSWLSGVLHGDMGKSLLFRQDVWSLLAPRIPTTALLIAYASVLIIVGGIAFGMAGGLGGRLLDGVTTLVTTVSIAVPSFVAAILLIAVFAIQLEWFPVFGSGTGVGDRLWHLTLPAVALAVIGFGFVARITRSAIREERAREHVETARARGLPERHIVRRHVLRNALIPITTVSGLTVASLIAGTVVVESAFGLNGIGSFLVQAVTTKDFAIVQDISLILVVGFVLVNTGVDIAYTLIDPRISLTRRPA